MVRNRKSIVRPRLDVLESRWCPACDIQIAGNAMFITGDAAANEITVFDDGTGVLIVECDGKSSEFTQPIRHVVIRSGGGDDFVGISSIPEFEALERNWTIDLGNGNDNALVFMEGIIESPVFVTVLGGSGADQLSVQTAARIDSLYAVTVLGGNDNDSIYNFASGPLNGTMLSTTIGGSGNDNISEEYVAFRVNGTFVGTVDGGAGVDSLSSRLGATIEFDPELPLIVAGFDVSAGAHALYSMTGGAGHDALFANLIGRIDGHMGILADGGNDSDDIFAQVDLHAASTGALAAHFRGGSGNDQLQVQVRFYETEPVEPFPGIIFDGLAGYTNTPAPMTGLQVVANGGSGFDSCLPSDWVTLLGIEDTQP